MPVLRKLRSYSRALRVISVSSVIQNLLLNKVEVACAKNALMNLEKSSSVQIVTTTFKVIRTSDSAVELNKRLSDHKQNNKPRRIPRLQSVQCARLSGQSLAVIIARFARNFRDKKLNRILVSGAHRRCSKLAICVTIANIDVTLATTSR